MIFFKQPIQDSLGNQKRYSILIVTILQEIASYVQFIIYITTIKNRRINAKKQITEASPRIY